MIANPISAVILTDSGGGTGTGEKVLCRSEQQRALDRLTATLNDLSDDIVLVVDDPLEWVAWDGTIARDAVTPGNLLTRLYAGLFAARHPWILVTACDRPWLRRPVLDLLTDAAEPRWDVILPHAAGVDEPYPAIYSNRCLKQLQSNLARRQFRFEEFLKQVRRVSIDESRLRQGDRHLVSLLKNDGSCDPELVEAGETDHTPQNG